MFVQSMDFFFFPLVLRVLYWSIIFRTATVWGIFSYYKQYDTCRSPHSLGNKMHNLFIIQETIRRSVFRDVNYFELS
jgi:hypothetical protein